jgi:peptidoglycan/LPS O-acetylase OafA/YrhL
MATDWDKELAKIDKQLASISDEELKKGAPPVPAKGGAVERPATEQGAARRALPSGTREPRRWALYLRLGLSLAAAVAIGFWPHEIYSIACGPNLFLYLAAAGLITAGGVWSAVWSWRHRAPRAHLLSLAIAMWGLMVAASEVLPRVGYARTPGDQPVVWLCK